MPKSSYRWRGVSPAEEVRSHILYRLQIEDVLDEDQFIEKMLLVRYRIICVFAHSVDPMTKKGVFGNYLQGVGPDLADLKRFVIGKVNSRGVLSRSDLPEEYRLLGRSWRQIIIDKIMSRLINRQIDQMLDSWDLWWLDSHGGIWEIAQSVVDEQKMIQSTFSTIYNLGLKKQERGPSYRDERTHHGKPSSQSRRRDRQLRQAPGISIGTSGY